MSKEIIELTETEMEALSMGKNDGKFQTYLNEKLSAESDTYIRSKTTILNMRVHGKPLSTDLLEDLLSVYPVTDRRFRFALRMLAAKSPHVWGFDGIVWRLKASRMNKPE